MLNKKVEKALNNQVQKEEFSSRLYLAMAVWCEVNGFPGASAFLYAHSDEERMHQMKMMRYVNERGGQALLMALEAPSSAFDSLEDIFSKVLTHEEYISASINELYGLAVEEKDYSTANFLQWYINEQVEEEGLMRTILDKIKLAGGNKGGMFHVDKELESMAQGVGNAPGPA